MAELAIGLSKTAVEALVNKVKSAIKEEAEQWQIVERDIIFIKEEFEFMRSFLNAASGERMNNNQVARTWVRQVRDLSYDTEDCIDFVLHLDTKRSFWQRLLRSNMVQKTLPLDQAVAEIKQLKARAEDVNRRNKRYNLISNTGEQVQQTTDSNQMTLDIIKNPTEAFDSEEDILNLTRLIKMEDRGLQVISVCGTGRGGLGAVSIIKKTYDDPEICKLFEFRSWVKLVSPFNPHEFIRSLLAGFYANSPSQDQEANQNNVSSSENRIFSIRTTLAEFAKKLLVGQQEDDIGIKVLATMNATQDNIIRDFMEIIKKKPYFIILEDLSSIVEWNAIKTFLPDMNNRSRIVVTTQQLEIASLCPEQPNHLWLLREFSTDHSIYAFFKKLPRQQQVGERNRPCADVQSIRNPGFRHWREHHNLYGRESELITLVDQISIAHVRKANVVIAVCGIAGVGKSFLVGAFYDHFAACFGSSAVVSAAHPFDITNFCQNLVDNWELPDGEDIFHRIWKHMEEKQCLVVIDDLRSKEDWDLLEGKLILRASRSCIIVITREESVARHCATSDNVLCRVKGLEADAARSLFVEQTRDHGGNPLWDSSLMDEAELIINKCGRLPKLSVALVRYLANVQNSIQEARRLNTNFMYALKNSEGLDSFRDVFTWIYSNFQASPQLLKKCVFYLSLFTQSSKIRQGRLVRRWIAEGYSEGTDSKSTVEYTKKLLRELANLGITGGRNSCQINSFFFEYVISRETEKNIFPPLEVSVLQGEGSLNIQHVGQHLAIGSSWKRDKFVFDNLDISRLRSLTVSRDWRPFLVSDRMRVLRVLDLEDTNVGDDDIEQVVKQLPRLKFLGLRRCVKVSCLPDSLGDLRQLQTLDIRHTSVSKLPVSIIKLQKLQYISAATTVAFVEVEPSTQRRSNHGHVDACDGIMVPRGIGALMALHRLGVVNVSGRGGKAILEELKNLAQLYKLGVSGINRRNIKILYSAIESHKHLVSLSLQFHKDKDLEWLGKIPLPGNLRRLKMYVHVVKYPHWSCLQVIGQIKRLRTLGLRFETGQDIELQFCDDLDRNNPLSVWSQFSEVKVLEIASSSNLHLKFTGREMFQLQKLKIHCLNASSLQLSGIDQYPHSLKHVWLKGSFDDVVKEELRRKVAQHPRKPFLKLD